MQGNLPGLKDMNFRIDRTYQEPSTMHENRPIIRHNDVKFQHTGGTLNLKSF